MYHSLSKQNSLTAYDINGVFVRISPVIEYEYMKLALVFKETILFKKNLPESLG